MRLNNVDIKNKTAVIKFDNDEESDLIAESLDLLIEKQEKIVKMEKNDPEEVRKLEKYRKTKKNAVDFTKIKKEKEKKLKERVKLGELGQQQQKPQKPPKKDDKKEDIGDNNNNNNNNVENVFISEADSKVHQKNIYDIVNAVNEHIVKLEQDQSFKYYNKDKYEKLQKILDKAQYNKSLFERVPPKPTKWGKLRK